MNIINKIDSYAKSSPQNLAFIHGDETLTYSELKHLSDSLAVGIQNKLKENKNPVVVFGHKSLWMLVSFLACVKSGRAYIPIDSSLPQERVQNIVLESQTSLFLAVDNITNISCETIRLEEIEKIARNGDSISGSLQLKADDIYYIIYTSGSTGKPKGVQISMHNLEKFCNWATTLINSQPNMVFLNQAPFSFDLSVMDLYLSLTSGGTLFSIDHNMMLNMKNLFEILSHSNVNVWVSTPSFANMVLSDSSFNKELLKNIKYFLFCGEILTNETAKKLHERFNAKIINTYGPTESTVAVTEIEITAQLCETTTPLPVGKAKIGTLILIEDDNGNILPNGEKGEIIVVGDTVSKGYYKRDDLTEKVFKQIDIDGTTYHAYKTGDLGYIKDDYLFFCGRKDFQIKLNGYRIEIEDIESNLVALDFVKNAVVIPVYKNEKISHLTALVVTDNQNMSDIELMLSVKSELKNLLPEYMVPRIIKRIDLIPMTTNGKADRKKLMEEY